MPEHPNTEVLISFFKPNAIEDRYVFPTANRGLAITYAMAKYGDSMLPFMNYAVATLTPEPATEGISEHDSGPSPGRDR